MFIVGFQRLYAQRDILPTVRQGLLHKNEIGLEYGSSLGSNGINKSLVFNDYWSNELVADQLDKLRPTTRLGFESSMSLDIRFRNKQLAGSQWSPMLKFSQNQSLGIGVDQALVQLYLQGNGPNKHVSIEQNSTFRQMRWTDVMLGLEHVNKAHSTRISIGLGYVAALGDQSGRWTSGDVLTSIEGDTVSIVNSTITYQNPSDENTGNGVTVYAALEHLTQKGHRLKMQVQDVGILSWTSFTQYQNTGDIVYEGLVWDASSQTPLDSAYDSLFNAYYSTSTLTHTFLPLRLSAEYKHRFSDTRFGYANVQYRVLPGNLPHVSVGMRLKHASKYRFVHLGATAGGYGMYGLQFGLETKLLKQLFVKLEAQGIESLITEQKGLNWAGQGRLYYYF